MARGDSQAVFTQDSAIILWKDNKPMYMASIFDVAEPMKNCQRYNRQAKGYLVSPKPNINTQYNQFKGGLGLVNNAEKNYAVMTRCGSRKLPVFHLFKIILNCLSYSLE
jgi:hypothetical protein